MSLSKSFFLVCFIFLVSINVAGQDNGGIMSATVDYVLKTKYSIDWTRYFELKANSEKSLFTEKKLNISGSLLGSETNDSGKTTLMTIYEPSKPNAEFYFNNLSDATVFYMFNSFDELLYVNDTVSLNWEVTEETRLLNDIVCTKATTHFRGRDYEAWFAKSIPLSAGPFKFYGLTGLILLVQSVDGQVTFEATRLNLSKEFVDIQNPINGNQKLLTFKQSILKDLKNLDTYSRMMHAKESFSDSPYVPCEDCVEPGIEIVKFDN